MFIVIPINVPFEFNTGWPIRIPVFEPTSKIISSFEFILSRKIIRAATRRFISGEAATIDCSCNLFLRSMFSLLTAIRLSVRFPLVMFPGSFVGVCNRLILPPRGAKVSIATS